MKIEKKDPPREFETGFDVKRTIKDCGQVILNLDEQVTFLTDNGSEYDVCRKDFGFYATPSLNGRLPRLGLRPVLVKNRINQFFILLVEKDKHHFFDKYMEEEKMDIVIWLDDEKAIKKYFETE